MSQSKTFCKTIHSPKNCRSKKIDAHKNLAQKNVGFEKSFYRKILVQNELVVHKECWSK